MGGADPGPRAKRCTTSRRDLKESLRMRGLDRIFSAALVVAIANFSLLAWAATQEVGDLNDGAGIETRVPAPTPAQVTPPTSADVAAPGPQAAPDLKPSATPDIKQGVAPEAKPSATPDTKQGAAPEAKPNATPKIGQAVGPDAKPVTTPDTGRTSKDAASPANSGVQDAAAPGAAPADSTSSVTTNEPAAKAPAPPPASAPPAAAQGAKPEPAAAATPAAKDTAKDNGKPLAPNLAAADVPIAEKLRDLVSGRLDHIIERKADRQAVEAFYTNRGFAPLWIEGGVANPRALSAITRLKAAGDDGLDPGDYSTPDFSAAADHPDVLADDELKLTNAALTYARHAQIGRVHFSRVSPDIYYNLVAPDPREV